MTERDFCYWLQGYFELLDLGSSSGTAVFSQAQATCIQRHIDLVLATGGASAICSWISGALAAGATMRVIRKRLGEHFKHVIDPATPGDPATLDHIHGNALYRC